MDKKTIKFIELKSLEVKPQFKVLVDYTDPTPIFCLMKIVDDTWEQLLEVEQSDEAKFKEEIENLSKYFNATILEKEK